MVMITKSKDNVSPWYHKWQAKESEAPRAMPTDTSLQSRQFKRLATSRVCRRLSLAAVPSRYDLNR
jgi:hypothetical protein